MAQAGTTTYRGSGRRTCPLQLAGQVRPFAATAAMVPRGGLVRQRRDWARCPAPRGHALSMQLPKLLQDSDDRRARDALCRYYGTGTFAQPSPFTGARFDAWDSTGSRTADQDRFTADDLVAVTFLSVNVPATAAIMLLDSRAEAFTALLTDLGADRDLVEETEPWADDWAGWLLWKELIDLPGVGATMASKLFARKRPRLRPIYDSVVAAVTGSNQVWEPLRAHLSSAPELHERLLRLRHDAGLPVEVSALRVFDVVTWMEGKYGLADLSI